METKTLALYLGCSVIATSSKLEAHKRKLVGVFQDGDDYQSVKLWHAGGYSDWDIDDDFKLLLRPLSSMTEEERDHYHSLVAVRERTMDEIIVKEAVGVQYLLSKHFDLFGLIEKGEAIDSTLITKAKT